MPGAVARTSSIALNNATLPFVLNLENKGYRQALLDDIHLRNDLNVSQGYVTHAAVAVNPLIITIIPLEKILKALNSFSYKRPLHKGTKKHHGEESMKRSHHLLEKQNGQGGSLQELTMIG